MRAVQFDAYGDPEVLHIADAPEPHAGPGQVRIAVEAASVNPYDWKVRAGFMAEMAPVPLPHIPGLDAAGVVDEVGEGVKGVTLGDRVFGMGPETFAERAVLDAWALTPDQVSSTDAASLGAVVETAARVLDLLDLDPGDLVVVDGAAGGVGTATVQLAVSRSLVVVGTASEANADYLRGLGALPTTYGAGLADRVRAIPEVGREPVAGALDLVGRGSVPDLVELTGDPAKVVTIADFSVGELGVQVSTGGGQATYALAEVADLVVAGRYSTEVTVFPWTEAAKAHALSQDGHVRGKLVVTVSAAGLDG